MPLARRLTSTLLACLVLAAGFVATTPRTAEADAATVYRLVNEARWASGLGGVARNSALDAVAQRWTQQMIASGTMSHNGNLSNEVPSGWRALGENVAKGFATDQDLHNAWMGSPGHRANILGAYNSIGIGWARDGAGRIWATQVFATYSGVGAPSTPALPPVCPTSAQQPSWSQPASAGLGFKPINPARLVDSRTSDVVAGGCEMGKSTRLDVQVTGRGGVPTSGVGAVALNVTCVGARVNTWLAAYPAGGTWPGTSSVNAVPGQDVAASVVVPVGSNGKVSVLAGDRSCALIVDVTGYFPTDGSGSRYTPATARRTFDGATASGAWRAVGTGAPVGATAVVGNVTLDQPRTGTYASVTPAATSVPSTSSINVGRGATGANRFLSRTNDTNLALYTSGQSRTIMDVNGWFSSTGLAYYPLAPKRAVDTRTGLGLPGDLVANRTSRATLGGANGVPAGAKVVAVTVTMTGSTHSSFVTAWQAGQPRPATSDVNAVPGSARANLVLLPLDSSGRADLQVGYGSTDVVVDVLGYFR